MMDAVGVTPAAAPKRRWPLALLVGFITAVAAAFAILPVADWVMEMHHVSTMEGGRACAAVALWMPVSGLVGFVMGVVATLLVRRGGFVGYLIPQGLALGGVVLAIAAAAGIGYATADHPPLLDGKELALEIEVQAPAKGRSVEALKAQDFSVALLSSSRGNYADLRWIDALQSGDSILVTAFATMKTSDAGRQISVGTANENRQLFTVMLPASPKKIDEEWSEWTPPRTTFTGSKPAPNDQYLVRYRVRFAAEYSPTPSPETAGENVDNERAETPSPTPDFPNDQPGMPQSDALDRGLLPSPTETPR
ncbi:MAG: hypothetical protein M3032_02770 [Verrucomicrobiota bacterium]|nr:hypothetical protein [Verrucomicrobiota bacterium]